jgi:hypothetical protein
MVVLRQEEGAFVFAALIQPWQHFTPTLVPKQESVCCAFPIAPVCFHADAAALEVA